VSYQVGGGEVVTEIVPGPLATGTAMQYTFNTTANLGLVGSTYTIKSFTNLAGDEFRSNDTITKSVLHLFPDDIGVTGIISPLSGSGLTSEEDITVSLSNFGTADQTNFEVSYQLNDVLVTEQVPGPLTTDSPINFTFSQKGDMMALGTYQLSAYTSLPGDAFIENDTTKVEIINTLCQPQSNCHTGTGIFLFQLGTIDTATDCSPKGYGDYTELSTELENNSINELTIATYYGSQYIKVWIDLNDNFVFEMDEVVVDNFEIAPGMTNGYYVETMSLTIPDGVNLGEHILRAKTNLNGPVPEDACNATSYGETEDYKVNLVLHIGVETTPFNNADMVIKTVGNNVFDISLETATTNETLIINLHNVFGQKLVENRVNNVNGKYQYRLDLSYAKPGAYIVRLGSPQAGKVKRIMVR